MSSVILEAHDLTKEYRHTVALDHIDLKIEKGKIYGFIGQNGAGKTTFLRLVTGLASRGLGDVYKRQVSNVVSLTKQLSKKL